jgi:hypothetical protein
MSHEKTWIKTPRRFTPDFLVMAAAAGCLLLTATRLVSQATPGVKLQPGTDLVKEILAKDGLYTRTTTSGTQYKALTERKFALKEVKGCQLVVVSDTHTHTEMPAQNRVLDRTWTETYYPDFSILDPASVVVSDPPPPQPTWETKGYLVRIGVEIGKPPISASTQNNQTNEAHDLPPLPNLAVYVASRDQADRLAKAFTQVATACHSGPAAK